MMKMMFIITKASSSPVVCLLAVFVAGASSLIAAETDPYLSPAESSRSPACHFVNGRWFDGKEFVAASFFAVNGFLTQHEPPTGTSCVVDLEQRYVIPPFGEAHIHALNDPETIEEQLGTYLRKGVFYVLVQDALFEIAPAIRELADRVETPDVVYAEGVLLAPWYDSVLDGVYRFLLQDGRFGERKTVQELDGRELFFVTDRDDLSAKADSWLDKSTDVVKVLLAFSDEFETRRGQPEFKPQPGIDPALLPEIVDRAHEAGRRVSVHIETAADFGRAVAAGADIVAHLPGWRIGKGAGFTDDSIERWKIRPKDAQAAAERGVTVVTTTRPKMFLPEAEKNRAKFAELHASNLELLRQHRVSIAIGSDDRRGLVPAEILHLEQLGVLEPAALLKAACETSARLIFPRRKLGRLEEGFEASFLVLDDNPLTDLRNIEKISIRVKQGRILAE